jgi:L-seryl-tRNA(Ser) seleniumtransferase
MTGTDPDKLEQLPDSTGLRSEVLIQRAHRYRWDKFVTLAGARLVEVGDADGTSGAQFDAAFGPRTLAVLHTNHLDGAQGSLPLTEVATIAHAHDVPVIVDAAYANYPVERFASVLAAGADLAIYSAKYFGGPNTGGFVCGRRDLIDAVAANDFSKAGTRAQHALGRPFKLDRQLVVGVVAALEEWLAMDHEARFEDYERKVQAIARRVRDVPGIELTPMFFTMEEELEPSPINCLVVRVDPESGISAEAVEASLQADNPSVLVHVRDDSLIVDVECVSDDEAELIGARLRRHLMQRGPG